MWLCQYKYKRDWIIFNDRKWKKKKEITSIYLIEKIHISAFFSPATFSQTESSALWQQRKESMKEKMQQSIHFSEEFLDFNTQKDKHYTKKLVRKTYDKTRENIKSIKLIQFVIKVDYFFLKITVIHQGLH